MAVLEGEKMFENVQEYLILQQTFRNETIQYNLVKSIGKKYSYIDSGNMTK